MIVGYTIGAIGIVFGLVVLYQIFTGSTRGLQMVSYPTIGIVLLIVGACVCYGVYTPNESKNPISDTDSPSRNQSLFCVVKTINILNIYQVLMSATISKCEVCGLEFGTPGKLDEHKRAKHQG